VLLQPAWDYQYLPFPPFLPLIPACRRRRHPFPRALKPDCEPSPEALAAGDRQAGYSAEALGQAGF